MHTYHFTIFTIMISTSCHIVSRLAITGALSVGFFNQAVLRPIRSGPRTGSANRMVASVCTTTVILVIAAHRTAGKILSGEIGAPSTGELTDTVPTAPDGPARKLNQETRPVAILSSLQSQTPSFPSSSSSSSSSSSPVRESTPSITIPLDLSNSTSECTSLSTTLNTTLDLSPPISKCNRISITSVTTLIAHDDDSKDVFTDEALDTKDVELFDDERTIDSDEDNYTIPHTIPHTKDDHQVDSLSPSLTIHNGSSPPKLRPLFLVDKFRTTLTNTTTNHSRSGSAHITDTLLQKTKAANSLHSGLSVTAGNDFSKNLEDAFTDEALDVEDIKLSGDKRTSHEVSIVT
ncbi:hypothetical protein DEU56DRAFT_399378 [Suillus clintonianus]|uniref:uncharacterized protein n=1 Tax=Suillus clintonianus TaxID=1904413 RepID=UPI001B874E83|nr:uncharacterized protein DEU56DRAFT_399378 [Suillus clintonianus]KAG2135125.1 hypothetical protein DEU56DRAFT_399378 [Suillus clintonianus]